MHDTDISLTSRIQRHSGLVHAEIEGEIVMMDLDQGAYYGLDCVASRIWQLIEVPQGVADICDRLMGEYDVAPEQCQRDVIGFLRELASRDLITAG